jgi:hypothetical protein
MNAIHAPFVLAQQGPISRNLKACPELVEGDVQVFLAWRKIRRFSHTLLQ